MKYKIGISIFTFLIVFSCSNKENKEDGKYILSNINIVDPIEGLSQNKSIIIEQGKVSDIVEKINPRDYKTYTIHDLSGKYIIPGLWDAHVHYAFNDSIRPSMNKLFLTHGITSVRDTGGPMEIVAKVKQHSMANPKSTPNIFIAGPLIDGSPNVYNNSSPQYPLLSIENKDNETIAENSLNLISEGVDFLKAYEMLTEDQFLTLTAIARKNNLKVTGHIPLDMDLFSAVQAGLNGMEHLRNFEMSVAKNAKSLLEQRKRLLKNAAGLSGGPLRSSIHKQQRGPSLFNEDENKFLQAAELLAKNQVWQTPTLVLYRNFATKAFKDSLFNQALKMLPKNVRNEWTKQIQLIDTIRSMDYSNWMLNTVNKLSKYDIPFMAGTDTPIGFLIPGRSLHRELELFVMAGFSNLEALQSATVNPAAFFGVQDKLGRIKNGYRADLVILDENPLVNIKNTQKIFAVIKDGKFY